MNRLRLWYLAYVEWMLTEHIQTTQELADDHARRAANRAAEYKATLDRATNELRRVRSEINVKAPPQDLHIAVRNWRLR